MRNKRGPEIRFPGFSGEWKSRKIGDIVTDVRRPIKMDDNENYQLVTVKRRNGGIISRGVFKGSKVLVKSQFIIRTGDFLISKRQVVHGANEIVPEDLDGSIVSNEYLVLNGTKDLDIEFLSLISKLPKMYKQYFLSSYGVDIEKLVFDVQDWKKRHTLVPSISEQNQIISFIKVFNETISLHKQELENLKQTKQGFLQKMFPKKGESAPNIRFPGFIGDWQNYRLSDIGATYTGLSGKTKKDFGRGEGRFITYLNVFANTRAIENLNGIEKVDVSDGKHQNEVIKGDLLFTTSSETPEEVGMVSCWGGKSEKMYLNSFCFGYRLNVEYIESLFLAYLLRSSKFRLKISILAQGSTRFNLSKKELLNLIVQVPSLEEQQKIGNFFKQLDDTIALHEQELDTLKQTKKAFLQKLFV